MKNIFKEGIGGYGCSMFIPFLIIITILILGFIISIVSLTITIIK